MTLTRWTVEGVVDAACRCLMDTVPALLQERLDADALVPSGQQLYAGALPAPIAAWTGRADDMAADRSTPSMFVSILEGQSSERYDSSDVKQMTSRLVVTLCLSEGDCNGYDRRVFQNAICAYAGACAEALETAFLDCDQYGAAVGVVDALAVQIPYSPEVRDDQSPVWLRFAEVHVDVTHRVRCYRRRP